jgi:hypothetical protein
MRMDPGADFPRFRYISARNQNSYGFRTIAVYLHVTLDWTG